MAEFCQTEDGLENHPQILSSGQYLWMNYVSNGEAIKRHPQRIVFEAIATFIDSEGGKNNTPTLTAVNEKILNICPMK